MPTLVTDPGTTIVDFPVPIYVDVCDALGDAWVPVPFLYCDRLQLAANGKDQATLRYEIGAGTVQVGQAAFADYQPLTIKGKFVRIIIPTSPSNIEWVGYVLSDDVLRDAVKTVLGVNKLVGQQQMIQAVGLEYFLDRKQIDSAIVRKTGFTPNWVRIERSLTFNGGATASLDPTSADRGNRSSAINSSVGINVYDFTDNPDPTGGALWSADQIINHLVNHHAMQDSAGADSPFYPVLDPASAAFLTGFYPTIDPENLTIFEVLNKICAPQRGLVWWTRYEFDVIPYLWIHINSGAPALVTMPSGGTLPANTNQETLDFDTEIDVSSCKIRELGHRDYRQVVVRGARMTSTCTLGYFDATLIPDWSVLTGPNDVGTAKKYNEAAKNEPGYNQVPPISDEEKKKWNDAFRRSDAYARVYSHFRIPSAWDGKTGDGGTGQRKHALPILSDTGSVTGGLEFHVAGIRMLNTLRLKEGWDYTNPLAPKSATPAGVLPQLAKPFALLQVSSSPDRFQYVNHMTQNKFLPGGSPTSDNIKTNYHLYMLAGMAGIKVQASGAMPHALAPLAAWAGASPSETEPEVGYDKLRVTVCLEADKFCEGKYPEDADLVANKPIEKLMIELGKHYRLDFLAENTVVGIRDGVLQKASQAAVLRDDRKYLKDVARVAYEWYQLDRNSLELTLKQVQNLFELGMLITTCGTAATSKTLNTVVSSITYDLINGTTTVETADDTLDMRSLVT